MTKNIFKININSEKGTGFFTKIAINDELIPVFITNYHVLSREYLDKKNEIEVNLYNDIINLNNEPKKIKIKNKVIYYNEIYDVTIIEINENKDGKYEYLELDENILNKDKIDEYIGKSIYILQFPCYYEEQKLAVSYGIIKNRFEDKEYDFRHYCSTEYGSSGSPILNIYNNRVIGIHKQRDEKNNYNIGSFLYYSIKEFINKFKEKDENKNENNKKNESINNECDNKIDTEYLKEFNKKYNFNIENINVTKLDLSEKKIGNEGLRYLCETLNFKEIKELNLSYNNISDINVLEKAKFEKLEILNLCLNKISNSKENSSVIEYYKLVALS